MRGSQPSRTSTATEFRPTSFRERTRIRVGEADLRAVNQALRRIPVEVRRKVASKGIRDVLKFGRAMAKSLCLPQDERTRKAIEYKVKTYRKKNVWGAVGVRVDGPYDPTQKHGERYPGWRSHMWDGGFRVWQKGRTKNGRIRIPKMGNWKPNRNGRIAPFIRKDRGWRKGIRRRGLDPVIIGRRLYLTTTAEAMSARAGPAIVRAVENALMEVGRGN